MPIICFRTPHVAEALNDKFAGLFKESDIIFLEQCYGDFYGKAKNFYTQLSQTGHAQTDTTDYLHETFDDKIKFFVANSKKQVEIEKSPFATETFRTLFSGIASSFQNFYNGKFKEACELKERNASYASIIDNARDRRMAGQLEYIQNTNPNKKILTLTGGSHGFPIILKRKGIKVRQEFPYLPYMFGFEDQLQRYAKFNKSIPKDVTAKAFVGNIFHGHLSNNGVKPPELFEREIKAVKDLSYEDVENLSKSLGRMTLSDEILKDMEVLSWLEEKGVRI